MMQSISQTQIWKAQGAEAAPRELGTKPLDNETGTCTVYVLLQMLRIRWPLGRRESV